MRRRAENLRGIYGKRRNLPEIPAQCPFLIYGRRLALPRWRQLACAIARVHRDELKRKRKISAHAFVWLLQCGLRNERLENAVHLTRRYLCARRGGRIPAPFACTASEGNKSASAEESKATKGRAASGTGIEAGMFRDSQRSRNAQTLSVPCRCQCVHGRLAQPRFGGSSG